MSSSLEMPSSGLVVVENSGTVEQHQHGHLIQQQTQQQQQQIHMQHNANQIHHQQPVSVVHQSGQHVVVNEEFINAETGGHYITTEIIGNGQILKFVSEEEAVLIEQQQQQHLRHQDESPQPIYVTQPQQQQPQDLQQPQIQSIPVNASKMQVVLSKQQQINYQQQPAQQHTINFVQNKPSTNFTYLTTSQAQIKVGPSTVNKMVNGTTTYKTIGTAVSIHQSQQQQINHTTTVTQKFATQKVAARGINTGRANTSQQQHMMVTQSTQRNAVQTMVTNQQPSVGGVIQQQLHIQTKQPLSKVVRTNKANNASSIKMMPFPGNATNTTKGVKTIPAHHMAPTKMTAKAKKQLAAAASASAANNQVSSNVIYTSGPQLGAGNSMPPKGGVHVQQIVSNNHLVKATSRCSATTSTNNIYHPVGSVQRPVNKTTKYLVQQQQLQQSPHMHQQNVVFQSTGHIQQQTPTQNSQVKFASTPYNQHQITMQQQQQTSMQMTSSGSAGSTIKYVNAQGNVIASPNRIRAILTTPHQKEFHANPQTNTNTTYYTSTQANEQQQQHMMPSSPADPMASPSSVYSNTTEDLLSEEMSARILQSFKQKPAFNNNNLNHNHNTMNRSGATQSQGVILHQTQPSQQQQPLQQFVKQSAFGNTNNCQLSQQQHQQTQQQIVYITNNEYGQPMVSHHQHTQQQQQQQQYLHRPVSSASTTGDAVDAASPSNVSNFVPQMFGANRSDSVPYTTTIVATNNSNNNSSTNDHPTGPTQYQRLSQLHYNNSSHTADDTHAPHPEQQHIDEELPRSAPINAVQDARLRAILHDHSYAIPLQPTISPSVPAALTIGGAHLQTQPMRSDAGQSLAIDASSPHNEVVSTLTPTSYQYTGSRTGTATTTSTTTSVPGMTSSHIYSTTTPSTVSPMVHIPSSTTSGTSTLQKALASAAGGFNYMYNKQNDDDTHSVISNGTTTALRDAEFNDEDTDTAPEGECEDDSVTRCICDLTHDDGYMICCDKCSAWQHVDCMIIDRKNIPDEYHCEVCKPRPVDRIRARSLQLLKRKEQQTFLLLNNPNGLTPQQLAASTPLPIDGLPAHIALAVGAPPNSDQSPAITPPSAKQSKSKSSATKTRKTLNSEGTSSATKRKRTESGSRPSNGKRKETKKVNTAKRRSGKQSGAQNSSGSPTEDLRQWIEHYETAVTNHYSPELRARLQAIGKQQHQHNLGQHPQLKNIHQLEAGKCTIVPHAGGKILISTLDLTPSHPVIEIQGKYMLSGQYKQQQHVSGQTGRNPGPFIFFYRLPNDGPEICVDTRTYGNEARFVRRSCRPNAEILHTIEKGTIHLYIVSLSLIKSSTEITIRHEPHDLSGIREATITSPTSTICACGLTKDCVFSSITPPVPKIQHGETDRPVSPPLVNTSSSKPTRPNGDFIGDDSILAATPVSGPPHAASNKTNYKRSKSTTNRNRSTSSSGESHTGMLSPTHQHGPLSISAGHPNTMHEPSPVYMSSASSSPPVSLASPSLPSPIVGQAISNQITYQAVQAPVYPSLPMEIVPHSPHNHSHHLQTAPVIHPITKQMVELPPATIHLVPALPKPTPPSSPAPNHFTTGGFASPPSATSVIQISVCTTMTTSTASIPSPVLPPATLSLVPTTSNDHQHTLPVPKLEAPAVIMSAISPKRPSTLLLDELTTTETLGESPRSQHDETPSTPVAKLPTSPMKSPGSSRSAPPNSAKKSPRKTSFSFSEDTCSTVGDETTSKKDIKDDTPSTPTPPTNNNKKSNNEAGKKLTREERKMQAIVKAFEKMEKNQLRKQELKQNKGSNSSAGTTPTTPSAATNIMSSRPNLSSPTHRNHKVGDENATGFNQLAVTTPSPAKRSTTQSQRKKKRKGNKSYNHTTAKKRAKNRRHSGDSDGLTSEDSSTLLSPNISSSKAKMPKLVRSPQKQQQHIDTTRPDSGDAILESQCTDVNGGDFMSSPMKSPLRNIRRSLSDQTTPPSFPLSSACMLIEAAVGPFERTHTLETREFKLPPKTKTKKTIMNDWLHQSVGEEARRSLYSTSNDQYEEKHQPPSHQITYSNCVTSTQMDEYPPTMVPTSNPILEPPQNLSMLTQRINEFISSANQECNAESPSEQKWSPSSTVADPVYSNSNEYNYSAPSGSNCTVITVPPAFPTPPMQCGSSVKKRWLRQAISEECSDDLPSPPNGYMTPLKKRRMARECSAAAAAAGAAAVVEAVSAAEAEAADAIADAQIGSFTVTEQSILRFESYNAPNEELHSYEQHPDEPSISSYHQSDHPIPEYKLEMKMEVEDASNMGQLPSSAYDSNVIDQKTSVDDVNLYKSTLSAYSYELQQPKEEEQVVGSSSVDIKLEQNNVKYEPKISYEQKTAKDENEDVYCEEKEFNEDGLEIAVAEHKSEILQFHESNIQNNQGASQEADVSESLLKPCDTLLRVPESDFILSRHDVSLPEPLVPVRSMPNDDEFDIKPLEECDVKDVLTWSNEESSPKRELIHTEANVTPITVSSSRNVDEIADIQKRLSSFHNENLMILQSRNKKKHSRATTPTMDDECSGSGAASRSVSPERHISGTPSAESSGIKKRKKGKHLNFDTNLDTLAGIEPKPADIEYDFVAEPKHDTTTSTLKPNNDSSSYSSFLLQPPPPPPPFPPPPPTNTTFPICDPKLLTPASIEMLTQTTASPSQPLQPNQEMSVTSSVPPTFNQEMLVSSTMPSFNQYPEVVSQIPVLAANKSLLSEYLENPNKSASLSSLSYTSPIPTHSMFNVSFSSLDATPATALLPPSAAIPTPPVISPSLHSAISPKIVTRTQSNDPRLNPSLTVQTPPPAPKRKLSINEYRKRKQQSSAATETPAADGSTKSGCSLKESGVNSNVTKEYPSLLTMPKCMSLDSTDGSIPKLNGSLSASSLLSPDDKITVFSPAPTLLELQQENLSLRLKNYKSLHGLTSQSPLIGTTSAEDKDKFDLPTSSLLLETSSKLSGSNSSLTSISSSASTSPVRSTSPLPSTLLSYDHCVGTASDHIPNGRNHADNTDTVESRLSFSVNDK